LLRLVHAVIDNTCPTLGLALVFGLFRHDVLRMISGEKMEHTRRWKGQNWGEMR
jgi:hypothetical protein